MNLKDLQETWNAFGHRDPLWAVLTQPEKKGRRWKAQEFFETGVRDIGAALTYAASLLPAFRRDRALDFGCGVGRLTQALANYFGEIWGVDIAPSMLAQAEKYNRHGSKVKYVLN